MEAVIRRKILALLGRHRNMTLATLRPDAWPQATTVGYANGGLTVYFLCGLDSQKATRTWAPRFLDCSSTAYRRVSQIACGRGSAQRTRDSWGRLSCIVSLHATFNVHSAGAYPAEGF